MAKAKHMIEMTAKGRTVVIDHDTTGDFPYVVYFKAPYAREWSRSNAFVELNEAIAWASKIIGRLF